MSLEATAQALASHGAGAVAGMRMPAGSQVEAAGWARLPTGNGTGERMERDTLLDLASVTKVAATTVLAMRLVAERELALETPARDHLPELTIPGDGAITVGQLLSHTAGVRPWWPLYCQTRDPDEAVVLAARLPRLAVPGKRCVYSDLSMILAGRVIERITGSRLDDAFTRLVAGPLGLADTCFGPVDPARTAVGADSDVVEQAMLATGQPYRVPFFPGDFDGWRPGPIQGEVADGNAAHAMGRVAGHAGLFGTVDDLLTLGSALRDGLVPHDVVERFARPTAAEPTQAVGFRLRTTIHRGEPTTLLWHPGFTGMMLAIGLDADVVIAGGATRLHGRTGPLDPDRDAPVPLTDPALIHETLLDGAAPAD